MKSVKTQYGADDPLSQSRRDDAIEVFSKSVHFFLPAGLCDTRKRSASHFGESNFTPVIDLTRSGRLFPQYTFNAYTKAFNKRYERSGTLLEGPFRALQIHTEPYLLNICHYTHANPVLHGITDDPTMWQFSNYLVWVVQRSGDLVDRAFISEYFDSPAAYKRFVIEYLRERELPQPLAEYLQELDD